MDRAVTALHQALDQQEGFGADSQALGFEEFGRDDGVGDAGLVFQAQETHALGGAGALTANHLSGHPDAGTVGSFPKLGALPDVLQSGAAQGHRMGARGEAECGVVGHQSLLG